MKLNEVIAKYGNKEVDETKIKEVLGVKESKVWEPKNGDDYWFVHVNGNIATTIYCVKYDEKIVAIGNCFKTKEEAEFASDKQIFLTKFERYLRENEDEPVDWNDEDLKKYHIVYDYSNDVLDTDYFRAFNIQGSIVTTSEDVLNNFIKTNTSDIKKYMFGV